MGARIELEGVSRRYRLGGGEELVAVDDVSLVVEPGAAVALMGPSGSGKSTLLHLVGAVDRADGGRVLVDGTDVGGLSGRAAADYRRTVGFVFQRYNLLAALSVVDNVIAPVLPYRVGFDKRRRARALVAAVGLGGRESSLPSRLSGGQQQRVAIARALVNEPRVVLADEPTGNLDSQTGREVLRLLLELRRKSGTTVIVATHDAQVAALCDRVVRLSDGRVVDDVAVTGADGEVLFDQIGRLRPD